MKYLFIVSIFAMLTIACSGTKNISSNATSNTYKAAERSMIMSADAAVPMRVYKITNRQDSILLRTKSKDVVADPDDLILQNFIQRLYRTVRDSMSLGVGIAPPQVGVLKNII